MKFLLSGLRTLIIAVTVFILFILIALSQGWHTRLVNHFAEPYKIQVGHTQIDWFPLSLIVEKLSVGEGASAFTLDSLDIQTRYSVLAGEPLQLFVKLEGGQVGYRQLPAETEAGWQVAGLSIGQWQQVFTSEAQGPENNSEDLAGNDPAEASASEFVVHLNSLEISDLNVNSEKNGLPDLQLKRLLFNPFYTDQPETLSSLQMELATAGGEINLTGTLSPLSAEPSADLMLKIVDFAPDQQWLAQIPEALQVALDTELDISVRQLVSEMPNEAGATEKTALSSLKAQVTGDLQLNNLIWQAANKASPQAAETQPEPEAEDVPSDKYALKHFALNGLDIQVDIADLQHADPKAVVGVEQVMLETLSVNQPGLDFLLQSIDLKMLSIHADTESAEIQTGVLELANGDLKFELAEAKESTTQASSAKVPPEAGQPSHSDDSGVIAEAQPDQAPTAYEVRYTGKAIQLLNQKVDFRDLNLTDAPLTQLELTSLQLDQPRYPAKKPFPWAAELWLNGQSHWLMNGDLQTAPLKVNLNIDQSGLNLPDISPYSEYYAEIVFDEGVMDNKIQFEITPDSLKGELGFGFNKLDMEMKGGLANLNLPVKTAFSMLEDASDRIELELKLDKKGEELNVGASAIVKELLLAASQKGTFAYLKYTLQPYGALLTLKDVGTSLMKSGDIPLEPVVLELLQAELTANQKGYALKISQILQDKKDLRLNYCYFASEEERMALLEQQGDSVLAASAFKSLNQNRLTEWRKLFAAQGLSGRMSQCSPEQQKARQLEESFSQSQFTILLTP
ncbi:DUF748 domain-containing protein [Oceanospirillum linum]|uniref:AsmA domain-containing protein n=1 Tax=Oceanospirillum linum TaxID=966 RepID=A0A1T1HAS2_OCELI|nr:DUF748 domain-containing protein [Oceanospirillum linum]OOV86827.1 hypothetical protein BTA35_0211040 [Oceanospirillum linum]SEG21325.1 protein of unknown function [Oleiphilus messinensis]SMP24983.1 protein of unknown function [Oceanospirillum linum]